MIDTVVAAATAVPGPVAMIRLSGPETRSVLRVAGLSWTQPGAWTAVEMPLAAGACPARIACRPAGGSATGEDLVELVVPGSQVVVDAVLTHLRQAGASDAAPGAFTRQAVANGRMRLDQAEALLSLVHASDAGSAGRALKRLQGELGAELAAERERLLHLRALVEAGLDFLEEDDVRSFDPLALQAELQAMQQRLRRWLRAAGAQGREPTVCLVGAANAGKSALFRALTGAEALVSAQPGTTRDWLQAPLPGAVAARLLDTAGWLQQATGIDARAQASAAAQVTGAALVLACSAPDAPLPETLPQQLDAHATVIIATKADLDGHEPRARLAVSAQTGQGMAELQDLIQQRLAEIDSSQDRQQACLVRALRGLADLAGASLPEDVLLADELAAVADALGELIGACTPDDVLEHIFARFCIGK